MSDNTYDALVESTKRFALLAETLERNAGAAVQQHQQSAQALQQTIERGQQQIRATADNAGETFQQAALIAIEHAFAPGTRQFEIAAQDIAQRMQQAGLSLQAQQAEAAASYKKILWKLHAIAIASVGLLLVGGSALIYYQTQSYRDARDRTRAAEVDAEIAEALKRAQVTSCGGRPCLKLDLNARRWGGKGEYVLLDGAGGKTNGSAE
jgi:hypothetical protein